MKRYPIDNARSYTEAKLHTGEIVSAGSRAHLRRKVLARLIEMGEPPLNLDSYVANAICDALPDSRAACECKFVDENSPSDLKATRRVRVDDISRFLQTMVSWVGSGGGLVTQEEADRRARICAQCPYAGTVTGCFGCSGIAGKLMEVVGGRTTNPHLHGLSCTVCGCALTAAVFMPLNVAPPTPLDYPEWCWKQSSAVLQAE